MYKNTKNLIKQSLFNYGTNKIQSYMPLYSTISYNGCTSVNQAIAYTIGMKVGLSLKVLTIILLFL